MPRIESDHLVVFGEELIEESEQISKSKGRLVEKGNFDNAVGTMIHRALAYP